MALNSNETMAAGTGESEWKTELADFYFAQLGSLAIGISFTNIFVNIITRTRSKALEKKPYFELVEFTMHNGDCDQAAHTSYMLYTQEQ